MIYLLILFIAPTLAGEIPAPKSAASDYMRFRDPFKVPDVTIEERDAVPELQKYSTSDFKLVAVVTGPVRMRAMVVAPNGKAHTVSEKMKIGQQEGFVKKITTQSVIVQEKYVNPLGEIEDVMTEIVFSPSQGNSGGVRR